MKSKKNCISASVFLFMGLIPSLFCFSQPDSISIIMDTSGYIRGDIHFNLIIAADKGYDDEVLRLLNEGAYINTRTDNGVTPLMYAVQNQHAQVVKILLANGANPNLIDFNGTPALIPAVISGNMEICELLIRKGADVNLPDGLNRTPLMHAVFFNDILLTDMLLYYDAEVNLTDDLGNSVLQIASYSGNIELVKLLSEHKATLEKADRKKFTPLHSSSQNGHEEVVDYLLSQGVSLSQKTSAGYTPLALSVYNNHYNVTALLIEKGANVNDEVAIAISPLNIAKSNKNDSISALLEEHGAELIRRPAIQYYSLNFDMSFSADDFFMGGGFGLHDTRYDLSASLGMATRISAKPVLKDAGLPNTYYQYWERRTYAYLGVYKRFKIFNSDNNVAGGFYAGAQLAYTFGKYRGTEAKPDPRLLVSPSVGTYLQFKGLIITAGYEYLNFKVEKIGPNRFKIGMKFLIAGKGMKQPVNKTLWVE